MQPTIIRAKVATPPKAPRKIGRDDKCPPEAPLFVTEDEVLIEVLIEVLVLKMEELVGLLKLPETELVTDGGDTEVTVADVERVEEAGEEEGRSEGGLRGMEGVDSAGAVDDCKDGINVDEQF